MLNTCVHATWYAMCNGNVYVYVWTEMCEEERRGEKREKIIIIKKK